MLAQTKQRVREVFGSASGNDVLSEFTKLDALGVTSATVEAVHTVLAGPATGSSALPTYRLLVTADLPASVSPTTLSVSGSSGFYGKTAVVQPTAGHVVDLVGAGTGAAVLADSTFTGGTGSAAYTVGDIVLALKQLGLIAS